MALVCATLAAAPSPGAQQSLDAIVRVAAAAPSPSAQQTLGDTERVAAFARLYGVVRYFHPSDAAQEIDWPRFVIYGAQRAKQTRDSRDLQQQLNAMFSPITSGVEIIPSSRQFAKRAATPTTQTLVTWRHLGLSLGAAGLSMPYASARTHREGKEPIRGYTTLVQTIEAETLRGRPIRLKGTVRATASEGDKAAYAALWIRIDRPKRQLGFRDSMQDRPIRAPEWQPYEIVGTVDADAEKIAFGVMASGEIVAGFDALALETQNVDGAWEPVKIADPGFEAQPMVWKKGGTSPNADISRQLIDAPQGKAWVRVQGKGDPNGPFTAPLAADRFADFELGAGLKARVPLVLTDTKAKVTPEQRLAVGALQDQLTEMPDPASSIELLEARQADVIVAWNVYRHFYPYWSDIKVDWDSRLIPLLDAVSQDANRADHLNTLRRLNAEVRDGHGLVIDMQSATKRAFLPILVEPVDRAWVVTVSDVPDQAQIGDVIDAVNGEPIRQYAARIEATTSGSPQWRAWRTAFDICSGEEASTVSLTLRRGGESDPIETQLTYAAPSRVTPHRLDSLIELKTGIWYVDLTRTKMETIIPRIAELAAAKAVIFDVRGYPQDSGAALLPHLLGAPEQAKWMHVPQYIGPFGEQAGWRDMGWNLKPAEPLFVGKRFVLTDAKAISYGESVMGYIADEKLAQIVGSPTAGTNGNTNTFLTPTGYRFTFTGMRVTRHDGTRFHLNGVQPTVPVKPTLEGIRAGQDEVLLKALNLADEEGG